jgi:predicted transcriptional regulator
MTEKTMNETISEVSVKQNEKNDFNVPDVLEEAKRLRSEGMSYEKIAKELNISKSKVFRLLKNRPTMQEAETVTVSTDPEEPSGTLPLEPPELMSDMELREESKRLKDEISLKRLRAKVRWLDYIARNPSAYLSMNQNWDGHENREIRELKEEIRELKTNIQNNPLAWLKTGIELGQPKGSGRDPMEYVLAGNQLRADVEKNVQSQYQFGVQKSEIDLKLAEMGQNERLENKKIDWQIEQRKEEKQERNELIGTVKEIFQGPVGEGIKALGGGYADRLRGKPNMPQPVRVTCPNSSCQKEFYADPRAEMVVCPHCGSVLQKQVQHQQPLETQEQQEPQVETPIELNPEQGDF